LRVFFSPTLKSRSGLLIKRRETRVAITDARRSPVSTEFWIVSGSLAGDDDELRRQQQQHNEAAAAAEASVKASDVVTATRPLHKLPALKTQLMAHGSAWM